MDLCCFSLKQLPLCPWCRCVIFAVLSIYTIFPRQILSIVYSRSVSISCIKKIFIFKLINMNTHKFRHLPSEGKNSENVYSALVSSLAD